MDAEALKNAKASKKLLLGKVGYGTGNTPEIRCLEAERETESIRTLLGADTDLAFVVTCLGGGCGTGVAPVVARESKKSGITTIGVATIPFEFEGNNKKEQALDGVRELAKYSDALFILNNQYLSIHHKDLFVTEAFGLADKIMHDIIKKLVDSVSRF